MVNLYSWQYCMMKVLAAEPQSKKKEWGWGVWNTWNISRGFAARGSCAAKSHLTSTQYRQLRRLGGGHKMQHTCLHRLDRNYVLITEIRMPRKRFLKIHSNFLSYSMETEMTSTSIHYWVPSKTIPKSRPKWAKSTPVFRPKPGKNHVPFGGGTYLYGLYKEEALPQGLQTLKRVLFIFAT